MERYDKQWYGTVRYGLATLFSIVTFRSFKIHFGFVALAGYMIVSIYTLLNVYIYIYIYIKFMSYLPQAPEHTNIVFL